MKLIVVVGILLLLLFAINKPNRKCMDGQNREICPKQQEAHRMCSDLANSYGTLPNYADNGCWLQTYQKCLGGSKNVCNCTQIANEKCYRDSSPPNTIYQKCMAAQGFARDPDRG